MITPEAGEPLGTPASGQHPGALDGYRTAYCMVTRPPG